jgi:putative thioredoxin
MTEFSFDSTTASFAKDVLERSKQVPVLVDFWAPWCAPCRALKPILEKLAVEYRGRFVLAKVNTDEHPEIAGRYGVRGIPNVKAFVDGELATEFTGAQPESAVRRFIEALLPSPGETLRRSAQDVAARGDRARALALLREAVAQDPANDRARIDLAALAIAEGEWDEAERQLDAVPEERRDEHATGLAAQLALRKKGQGLADLATLKAAVDAAPDALDNRLAYAERLAVDGRIEASLDELIEIVRRGRGEPRERARRTILDLFSLAADRPDLVGAYRRKLAAALY